MKPSPDPEYAKMAKQASPPSKKVQNAAKAFLVGGLICCLGQGFLDLYLSLGMKEETAKLAVPITLIVLTAILTGLGVFGKIAKKFRKICF